MSRTKPEVITDMATLRARLAEGSRVAAARLQASGLPGAADLARRISARADEIDAGAPLGRRA